MAPVHRRGGGLFCRFQRQRANTSLAPQWPMLIVNQLSEQTINMTGLCQSLVRHPPDTMARDIRSYAVSPLRRQSAYKS